MAHFKDNTWKKVDGLAKADLGLFVGFGSSEREPPIFYPIYSSKLREIVDRNAPLKFSVRRLRMTNLIG